MASHLGIDRDKKILYHVEVTDCTYWRPWQPCLACLPAMAGSLTSFAGTTCREQQSAELSLRKSRAHPEAEESPVYQFTQFRRPEQLEQSKAKGICRYVVSFFGGGGNRGDQRIDP